VITVSVAPSADVPRHGAAPRTPDRPLAVLAGRRGWMLRGLARHDRTVAELRCRIHDLIPSEV
jgi:hypothetical protein